MWGQLVGRIANPTYIDCAFSRCGRLGNSAVLIAFENAAGTLQPVHASILTDMLACCYNKSNPPLCQNLSQISD